ncbi:sarcosine oxidase subunit delta [Roseovarius spongiae]|uniref:Sarcosine oxidase subunit delta n=1 Tax=Roseovarius spongiae TaxID=2320272 RepID=A0A3A8AV89_9RHOB|nr:sarcosine oxidase subunit delta [Roseovarius spongiae]RKF16153.1 sarcosine oxidase subunit delta [Roseovarius spongiae]
MQIFPCPFCGPRDEREFHFATEAGKPRPEPADKVSAEDWAAYLYANEAPRGEAREVWLHLTCGEYFVMTRDTLTREVKGSETLPGRRA